MFTTSTGQLHIFSKSGRGVITSKDDRVIRSPDPRDAKTLMLVSCLAVDAVEPELRPRCVSFMDPDRTDWYVRQRDYYLYVEPASAEDNLALFQQDASFILHSNTFYPGYYAIEHIISADHYIRVRDDGYLWIENEAYTSDYIDAASFTLGDCDTCRTYQNF